VCVAITISVVPFVTKSESALQFLQNFYGDVFGVVAAIYVAGIFSKRSTPWAAFFSIVTGIILGFRVLYVKHMGLKEISIHIKQHINDALLEEQKRLQKTRKALKDNLQEALTYAVEEAV